jgi:hypothetical protein
MIEKFPIIKGLEVVLARADVNTGIVLDCDFKYATSENQKVYTIFPTLEHAIAFAKATIAIRENIECWINGIDDKPLFMLNRFEIKNLNDTVNP